MTKGRTTLFIAGALVLGLMMGTLGVASAAPAQNGDSTTGLGLQLGATFRQAGQTLADTVAKLTGQSVADVRAARSSGASLASIAAKKGVTAKTVVDQTVAARKATLSAAVKSGRITQAQADAAAARMASRMNSRVSATGATNCDGNGGGNGGGGRGMGRGGNGGGCGGACGAVGTAQ